MSKIVKMKSGSWHTRIFIGMDDGKPQYKSVTADTKADVEKICSEIREGKRKKISDLTVKNAIERYVEISEPVLSPTTIQAYKKISNFAFKSIMNKFVVSLDDEAMQHAINLEAKRINQRTGKVLSAKTIKNEWGLLAAALKTICNRSYNIRLPKIQTKKENLPHPKTIQDAIRGTIVELPCMLAMWCGGLRMSEILGLDCDAIDGFQLHVRQVRVSVNNMLVTKPFAKTDKSLRTVFIPDYVLSLIKNTSTYKNFLETGENGPLVTMSRDMIYHHFTRIMKENGIELSFHGLRHEYASIGLNILRLPLQTVLDSGGWENEKCVMKYYSQGYEEEQRMADQKRNDYMNSLLDPDESKVLVLDGSEKNMNINMKKNG